MATRGQASERQAALDRVLEALRRGGRALTAEDREALSDLDTEACAAVAGALGALDAPARFAVVEALAQVMRESLRLDYTALFLAFLGDADAAVRAAVAEGLGQSEAPEAIDALLGAAQNDADPAVRSEAAWALADAALRAEFGRLPAPLAARLVEGLRAIAEDVREEPEVRAGALASVAAVRADWVPDLIYDAYETGDASLRLGALTAMGRTADVIWLDTLFVAAEAPDEDERRAAARAVGEIGEEDAVPALAALLDDESLEVVVAALEALGEIGGPEAVDHLARLRTHPQARIRDLVLTAIDAARFPDDPLGLQR